jgi:hypothetical protein
MVTATDSVGNATTRTGQVAVTAPAPPPSPAKPELTGVKLTNKTIHTTGSAAKPRATRLRLTLNVDATVVVRLKRTHHLKGKRVTARLDRSLEAGKRSIGMTSKVGGKKLPPGTYRVVVVARNAAGRSPARTVRLTIKR